MAEIKGLNKKFSFKIENATGSTKNVALLPGTFPIVGLTTSVTDGKLTAASVNYHDKTEMAKVFQVDAILDDGTIETNLTGTAQDSKFTIRHFFEYLRTNVEKIKQITIQADDDSAFSKQITIGKSSPLRKEAEDTINLNDYFDTKQFQSNKIVIDDLTMEFCDDTVMILPVDTAREIIITYMFE